MLQGNKYKYAMLCGVAGLAMTFPSSTSWAQDQLAQVQPPTEQAVDQDAQDAEEREVIVVTGTRIKRDGFTAPSPVTVLSDEAISLQGEVNLANVLNQLPALGSTFTNASSTGFIGTTGLSFLDLRRLGTDRTLVLVNGRRHVGSSAGSAAIDINSIPQELVERVEVVTGGASAIYGADAVSGAVNFVMKQDYEGVSLYGQMGQADEGNAFSYTIRGIAGSNFDNDRGNAVITFEYSNSDGFIGNDRSYNRRNLTFVENPENGDTADNPNDGIPDNILVSDARLNFITIPGLFLDLTGVVDDTFEGFQIDEGGGLNIYTPGDPRFLVDGIDIGGDGLPLSDITGSLQGDLQRVITTARINYELDPLVNVFLEAKYVNAQSFAFNGTGAFDIFSLGISADNAFIPSSVRTLLDDAGIPEDDSTIFLVSRSHNEAERTSKVERQLFRSVIGFDGEFENGIDYELSFVWGRATNQIQQGNNRINDRFFAGVDAVIDPETGNPVCRVSIDPDAADAFPDFAVDGCVPINLFGPNTISEEAIDWAYADGFVNESLEQSVITLAFTGDTSAMNFELPAGPIGWAAGTEYRHEKAKSFPSEVDQLGLTFLNIIPPTTGSFDVWEIFGEVSIPVLADLPFAEELSIDGAVRYADYSTVGSATSWKIGGSWTPVSDLRIRGTYSRAIRAPNISELFGPQSQTFLFFDDPCDAENLDQGSENRAANCTALGAPPGYVQDNTVGNTPGTTGGNPNVGEERANTWTLGGVLTPEWAPGLGISIDYWNVDIKDAISTPTLDDVLSNCVDGASIDNEFCPLITRDPTTFQVTTFVITNQNFAGLKARGLDFEVNYTFDLEDIGLGDAGTLDTRVIGTRLLKLDNLPFQSQPDFVDEELGELGDPKWVVNFNTTWNWGDFTLNYELRYLSKQLLVEIDELAADPDLQDPFRTSSTMFHDIQGRYMLSENIQLFAGINNVAQKFPPLGLSGAGTGSAIFDNIGRFYYGGVRLTY